MEGRPRLLRNHPPHSLSFPYSFLISIRIGCLFQMNAFIQEQHPSKSRSPRDTRWSLNSLSPPGTTDWKERAMVLVHVLRSSINEGLYEHVCNVPVRNEAVHEDRADVWPGQLLTSRRPGSRDRQKKPRPLDIIQNIFARGHLARPTFHRPHQLSIIHSFIIMNLPTDHWLGQGLRVPLTSKNHCWGWNPHLARLWETHLIQTFKMDLFSVWCDTRSQQRVLIWATFYKLSQIVKFHTTKYPKYRKMILTLILLCTPFLTKSLCPLTSLNS